MHRSIGQLFCVPNCECYDFCKCKFEKKKNTMIFAESYYLLYIECLLFIPLIK